MARDDPSVHFRLPKHELATIDEAIARSGLGAGTWWRVMGLAAAGETELAAQIKRAAKAGVR